MAFLAPAFLFGLFALAVPLLIHLVNRERRQVRSFPSLMFLSRVPHRSVRRQRVRHWLLLALRCAALVLLALAFARPVLTGSGEAATVTGGAAARVVVLDRSYSMAYEGRWPRALAAARDALSGLGPEDRVGLVQFGERAEAAGPLSRDPAPLLGALAGARPGWEGTRLAPALKLAARMLDEAAQPRRELVLISDFQKRGLDGLDGVRLPAGAEVRWVDLSDAPQHNLGVAELTLQRVYEAGRERIAISARIVSQGESIDGARATLELEGRTLQTLPVGLGDVGATTLLFEPVTLPEGPQRGVVRLSDDALAPDDAFHFVLSSGQELGVLIVERDGARSGESLYLRRALAIGDRPRFRVRRRARGALTPDDLAQVSVVVLNDAAWPAGSAGAALKRHLEAGGGLLAALGERSGASGWGGGAAELLPGTLAPDAVDRSSDWGGTLSFLDYEHPVFELFSRPRSGDFSQARFLRYRSLLAPSDAVLARFDDGAVALAEHALGKGRALYWTSSLDTLWSDLALQPVFLPFVHRLISYAARYEEQPVARRVGDVVELPSAEGGEWIRIAPSQERARLAADERFLELREAGFYELRPGREGGAAVPIAVNVDPGESDLTPADPEELASSLARAPAGEAAGDEPLTAEERERRQGIWWFALLLAGLVLAGETVLSNNLSRIAK